MGRLSWLAHLFNKVFEQFLQHAFFLPKIWFQPGCAISGYFCLSSEDFQKNIFRPSGPGVIWGWGSLSGDICFIVFAQANSREVHGSVRKREKTTSVRKRGARKDYHNPPSLTPPLIDQLGSGPGSKLDHRSERHLSVGIPIN